MSKKKDPNRYPTGLDATKVKNVLDHYERQSDEEAADEILNAPMAKTTVWVEVQADLLPAVRKLIAKHKAAG